MHPTQNLPTDTQISQRILEQLTGIVGETNAFLDEEDRNRYSRDETEDLSFVPDVVLKPADTQQVSRIMQICYEYGIPVTPRGAGTGLSGGCLPVQKGVVLSMERFNKILDIDIRNLQATVEPGVVTQVFQEAVAEKGLFYPPDPASRGSCSLGGNLGHCSGGPRAVKYGITRDYVLNLEVVLPTGEIIWTGANVLKNSTGYNLTQLIVGSEGTLGIITKIVFKLLPHPARNVVMLVPFASAEEACEAVSKIFMAGIVPSCLEFMERDAIDKTIDYLGLNMVVPEHIQAHLLIEVDGNDTDAIFKDAEKIYEVLSAYHTDEIMLADTTEQKEILWQLRRKVPYAVRHTSVYKEEDTVVPRAELPKLLRGVKEIGWKYGFRSVCYGHVGDGNLHVNILKGDLSDYDWNHTVTEGIVEIFQLVVRLGGTISGEHGIGLVQRPYIGIALGEVQLNLMRGIKKVFDPKGILNPGKIF